MTGGARRRAGSGRRRRCLAVNGLGRLYAGRTGRGVRAEAAAVGTVGPGSLSVALRHVSGSLLHALRCATIGLFLPLAQVILGPEVELAH
jgi:hypothetical protein